MAEIKTAVPISPYPVICRHEPEITRAVDLVDRVRPMHTIFQRTITAEAADQLISMEPSQSHHPTGIKGQVWVKENLMVVSRRWQVSHPPIYWEGNI
jgi:hypothetical protein